MQPTVFSCYLVLTMTKFKVLIIEIDFFLFQDKRAKSSSSKKSSKSSSDKDRSPVDKGKQVTCDDLPATSPIRCSCRDHSKVLKSMLRAEDDATEAFLKLMDDMDQRLGQALFLCNIRVVF